MFQGYNGALQSLPSVFIAFFAGPLSDSCARKPFIALSLGGYILLSAIFLVNSIWFYELKVGICFCSVPSRLSTSCLSACKTCLVATSSS